MKWIITLLGVCLAVPTGVQAQKTYKDDFAGAAPLAGWSIRMHADVGYVVRSKEDGGKIGLAGRVYALRTVKADQFTLKTEFLYGTIKGEFHQQDHVCFLIKGTGEAGAPNGSPQDGLWGVLDCGAGSFAIYQYQNGEPKRISNTVELRQVLGVEKDKIVVPPNKWHPLEIRIQNGNQIVAIFANRKDATVLGTFDPNQLKGNKVGLSHREGGRPPMWFRQVRITTN